MRAFNLLLLFLLALAVALVASGGLNHGSLATGGYPHASGSPQAQVSPIPMP